MIAILQKKPLKKAVKESTHNSVKRYAGAERVSIIVVAIRRYNGARL
jgi:hypothetical protein